MKPILFVIPINLALFFGAIFLSVPTYPEIGLEARKNAFQQSIQKLNIEPSEAQTLESQLTSFVTSQSLQLTFLEQRKTYLFWLICGYATFVGILGRTLLQRKRAEQGAGANG